MLQTKKTTPATYNKQSMASIATTTTPPKKQKRSFGMRSILTVIGLSLFFVIAISGVLIAQKQRQVKEPVAPTAPVSKPSAAEPTASVDACTSGFSVGFSPGSAPTPTYSCDTECTDDYQCQDTSKGGSANYSCYRPNAGTTPNSWISWLNINEAINLPDEGFVSSFMSWTQPDGSIKQYVVRSGELFVRTSDTTGNNWSALVGPNSVMDGIGSGTLTSFSAAILRNGSVEQHAVKGGKIWRRISPDNNNWSDPWIDHTSNVQSVGTGIITSFSQFIQPDGILKQYLVRGGKLWVRQQPAGGAWGEWIGPNTAFDGVGSGDFTSFSSWIQKDNSIKQFATRGGILFARDNAGGKCRLTNNLTSATCTAAPVTPGVASCTSKKAFTDFSYNATSNPTEITATDTLVKGQKFVYRITVTGTTTSVVKVVDVLPPSLNFVGPTNDSVIKYDATHRQVLVAYDQISTTPKVVEFQVSVAQTAISGSDIINKAIITTGGDQTTVSPCSLTLKVAPLTPTYSCNSTCTADAQCQTVNNDYVCAADQGNRCRLDTNRGSETCEAPAKTYTCNATCDTTTDCQSYNANYVCYNAGGTTGKVCRLSGSETSTSCQSASAPSPTPTVGCNQTCVTTADCSNPDQICYDTALVGQTTGKVCRLANYVNSSTCTTPTTTTTYTPPTTTTSQPVLPQELPKTGPEDWLNWLKAGLITLGVGAALLLLI